jgi:integrase
MTGSRKELVAPGVYKVHKRNCASKRCKCTAHQAEVWLKKRDGEKKGKRIRTTCRSKRAAQVWQAETRHSIENKTRVASTGITVAQALDAYIANMRSGVQRDRSGSVYKPSTIRRYALTARVHLVPEIGDRKLSDLDRADVRKVVQRWSASGQSPSSIRNNLDPLRCTLREALHEGTIGLNPCDGVRLPANRGGRDRVASPAQAHALLEALSEDRALWATAFYAGLRCGELQALTWADIDLDARELHVSKTYDKYEGPVATKTKAGVRTVPVPSGLRTLLVEHRRETGRVQGLVFGVTAASPFNPEVVKRTAMRSWGWRLVKDPGKRWVQDRDDALEPISLHSCRHSFVSFLIASGADLKTLTSVVGHSDIRTTLNVYGHLLPDSLSVAADRLDAYLEAI